MSQVRYELMTAPELAAAREHLPLIYLPLGSLEYHGFHLPVGLDTLHAYRVALEAAAQTGGVVLPPLWWGTRGHEGFPGSLLLEPETVAALVRDLLQRLTQQQYRLIVVVNGHFPAVQGELLAQVVAACVTDEAVSRVLLIDPFSVNPADTGLDHAGRVETSLGLVLAPEATHPERLSQPGALHAIGADCTEGSAAYGEQKLRGAVAATVARVRRELKQITG